MEKKNSLLDISYQNVLRCIVGAVRRVAKTIPVFRDSRNGCIRITMIPLSRVADEWLGGGLYDHYEPESIGYEVIDSCEREFVFKINPRGSHTIQYVCDDGHIEPVNCYGYSALKTAWASQKRKIQEANGESSDGYNPRFYIEENGWSMHDGSVWTTITIDGEEFMRLYVCTSGAKSSEDKECSLAGILEAQTCFEYCKSVVKFDPYIDGKKYPLEQIECN